MASDSQSLLVDLAGSWPPSFHKSKRGGVWNGRHSSILRLAATSAGVVTAAYIWTLDAYIQPRPWIMTIRLLYNLSENFSRARRTHRALIHRPRSIRLLNWAWWSAWSGILLVLPSQWRDTADILFITLPFGATAAWLRHLQSDKPPGADWNSWTASTDMTLGFLLGSIALYGPSLSLFLPRTLRKVFGPLRTSFALRELMPWGSGRCGTTCITRTWSLVVGLVIGGVLTSRRRLVNCALRLWRTALSPAALKITMSGILCFETISDVHDIVEAYLLHQLPRIARRFRLCCQRQQRKFDSIESYHYEGLRPGEIRLLILKTSNLLLPGTLMSSLLHVQLTPQLEYEALSYRWGSSDLTDEIVVDGARLFVTAAAKELLLARQSPWCERAVWIDGICINQSDDIEKGLQVQKMGDIYQMASRVILFPTNHWMARLAARTLFELGSDRDVDRHRTEWTDLRGLRPMVRLSDSAQPRWHALVTLLKDAIFERAWIVQEIALGQKVELYLGGLYLPWETLYNGIRSIMRPGVIPLLGSILEGRGWDADRLHMHNIAILHALRGGSQDSDTKEATVPRDELLKVEALLSIVTSFSAGDPRDKVFAMLGMAGHNGDIDLLRPNYQKSTEQVFEDTAIALLARQTTPAINLLAFAGIGFPRTFRDMPSWVPDYHIEGSSIRFTNTTLQGHRFQATTSDAAQVRQGDLPGSMSVRGVFYDVVSSLSHHGPLGGSERQPVLASETIAFIDAARSLMADFSHQNPPRTLDPDAQLWGALIAEAGIDVPADAVKLSEASFDLFRAMQQECSDFEARDRRLESTAQDRADHYAKTHQSQAQDCRIYQTDFVNACGGRQFGITEDGRLCLVPGLAAEGDAVFIPFGAQMPYLIRRQMKLESCVYELVGEAYVQGLTQREALGSCADWVVLV